MNKLTFTLLASISLVLAGCINSSTAWTNRSVTYQVTPENIGEHSSVSGSPTSNDTSVNADKTLESAAKTNIAQQLTDTSSNEQMNKDKKKEDKKEEKPEEAQK